MKKTAKKCILLFKDAEGFGDAVLEALQPSPSSNFQRLESSFELSLQNYGIKDSKACGNIVHFLNNCGEYEVSVLLLEDYKPPILVCALNEVLGSLFGGNASGVPSLVIPFVVASSKHKLENKNSLEIHKYSLYGIQFGPTTESIEALAIKVQKPPLSLQIHHEQLACLLQLVRVSKIPTFVIVGCHSFAKEFLEVINDVGEMLAAFSSLSFIKEKVELNPVKSLKVPEESWRALYG